MTPEPVSVPDSVLLHDLKQQIASGQVIVIAGAGVSMTATAGTPVSSWRGLLLSGVDRCVHVVSDLPVGWADRVRAEIGSGDIDDLLSAAEKVSRKLTATPGEFSRWLRETVGTMNVVDGAVLEAVMGLQVTVATTNYDGLFEACSGLPPVLWKDGHKAEQVLRRERPGILHLHGFWDDPDSVVLGIRSYEALIEDRHAQAMLRALRSLRTLLFVGFGSGLEDPNFGALLRWARTAFATSESRHFRLVRSTDVAAVRLQHSSADNVYVLSYGADYGDLAGFLRACAPSSGIVRAVAAPVHAASTSPVRPPKRGVRRLPKYLASVADAYGYIRFLGLPQLRDDPDVVIDKLYIEPRVSQIQIDSDLVEARWPQLDNPADVLERNQKLVLLGAPGSGKSSLVCWLAWQFSRLDANAWTERFGELIPLPFVVRELALRQDLTWETLLEVFLKHRIGSQLGGEADLREILEAGRGLILVDGMDEIASVTIRAALCRALQDGMTRYPGNRWVCTSRIVGYEEAPLHIVSSGSEVAAQAASQAGSAASGEVAGLYFIAPFSDEQIEQFARSWYVQREPDREAAQQGATELVAAIVGHPGTHRLARIPNLLTMMALIHRVRARLPHGRVKLYEWIGEAYLEFIDDSRRLAGVEYSLEQKRRWLAEVGYRLQQRRGAEKAPYMGSENQARTDTRRETLADREEVRSWIAVAMADSLPQPTESSAEMLLEYLTRRSGLLLPKGENKFGFTHLSFQEYFAAVHLARRLSMPRFGTSQPSDPTDAELRRWANSAAWRETLVLLFESLADQSPGWSDQLLEHVFGKRLETDNGGAEAAAAQLLAELATDPYAGISAASSRAARRACWEWEIRTQQGSGILPFGQRVVTRTLSVDLRGNLLQGWTDAGLKLDAFGRMVRRLSLEGCINVSDVSWLAVCAELRVLYLNGCSALKDIGILAKLARLREVSLLDCVELEDLTPLLGLRDLSKVVLTGAVKIRSEALSGLPRGSLEELYLARTGVVDLDPVSDCTKLAVLGLNWVTGVRELRPLEGLTALAKLSLNGTAVRDLGPLQGLPALKELTLRGCSELQDVGPLASLKSLEELDLTGCRSVRDLRPLSDLKQLVRLSVEGCGGVETLSARLKTLLAGGRGSTRAQGAARPPKRKKKGGSL